MQWLKPYVEFNIQKRTEAEKTGSKERQALYKIMKNGAYGKTMKNLRNRIDVKLVSNKRDYLKCASKPSYMSHKIFKNVPILKNTVTLTFKKPAYMRNVPIRIN